MIASAINDRLQRKLDYVEEGRRVSSTPLGPGDCWSQSLRTTVSLVVESKFPMALLWGPELLLIYNDAYKVIAADKSERARPVNA